MARPEVQREGNSESVVGMKTWRRDGFWRTLKGHCSIACGLVLLVPSATCAESEAPTSIQSLKKELEELRQRTQQLEQKLGELESARIAAPPAAVTAPITVDVPPATSPPQQTWSPTQPIPVVRSGQAYMNLSFGTLATVGWSTSPDVTDYLELGHHDPAGRGFTVQSAEIALDGAVDPYFRGFGNICFGLDPDGETHVGLEEAYLLTTSLPGNLQVKAGEFLAEFGRQNTLHAHQWEFVDQAIILDYMFGPHGLRDPGARLSWLVPTPFYTELMLGVFDGQGNLAFSYRASSTDATHGRTSLDRGLRGPGDLLYVPRIISSFDLGESQTLVVGASVALGPNNSGADARSQIYGVDLFWKWKPINAEHGFPFLAWQTEALYRQYEAGADSTAGLPSEKLEDWGFYSQLLWGWKRRWVAGLRGEWVDGNSGVYDDNDRFRGERIRVAPNLTFYPSEFSKFRLQYNFDDGERFGTEHSVWLQFEFLLGTHGAHKF